MSWLVLIERGEMSRKKLKKCHEKLKDVTKKIANYIRDIRMWENISANYIWIMKKIFSWYKITHNNTNFVCPSSYCATSSLAMLES